MSENHNEVSAEADHVVNQKPEVDNITQHTTNRESLVSTLH